MSAKDSNSTKQSPGSVQTHHIWFSLVAAAHTNLHTPRQATVVIMPFCLILPRDTTRENSRGPGVHCLAFLPRKRCLSSPHQPTTPAAAKAHILGASWSSRKNQLHPTSPYLLSMAAIMVGFNRVCNKEANLNFTLLKRVCDLMDSLLELLVQIRELMALCHWAAPLATPLFSHRNKLCTLSASAAVFPPNPKARRGNTMASHSPCHPSVLGSCGPSAPVGYRLLFVIKAITLASHPKPSLR